MAEDIVTVLNAFPGWVTEMGIVNPHRYARGGHLRAGSRREASPGLRDRYPRGPRGQAPRQRAPGHPRSHEPGMGGVDPRREGALVAQGRMRLLCIDKEQALG